EGGVGPDCRVAFAPALKVTEITGTTLFAAAWPVSVTVMVTSKAAPAVTGPAGPLRTADSPAGNCTASGMFGGFGATEAPVLASVAVIVAFRL
ncbi:MAG TPA: hypothetical protein VKP11_09310, partial [Frankiaceae bacterium]|nr:hypothetical protein [Frankiaceae bacterium]